MIGSTRGHNESRDHQLRYKSYEQQERENAIALLKLLTLSEKDKAEGRVFSKEPLLDGL